MLIEAIVHPIRYRWPDGEVTLEPGTPVDLPDHRARRLLEKAPGKVRLVALQVIDSARDIKDSILAVKVGRSVIGEYWLCLSETEPFEPGDGLPIYRPSEIKVLKNKGHGPDALRSLHQAKVELAGKVIR